MLCFSAFELYSRWVPPIACWCCDGDFYNNGISVMMMLMILMMMIVVVVVIVMIWLQYGGPHRETLPKFFCKLKKYIEMFKKVLTRYSAFFDTRSGFCLFLGFARDLQQWLLIVLMFSWILVQKWHSFINQVLKALGSCCFMGFGRTNFHVFHCYMTFFSIFTSKIVKWTLVSIVSIIIWLFKLTNYFGPYGDRYLCTSIFLQGNITK